MNINECSFYNYINEDKSSYPSSSSVGFNDPDDDFLIGESGGFLLNIRKGVKFINTHLFTEAADYYRLHKKYTNFKEGSIPYEQFRLREERRRRKGFTAPCLLFPDGTIKDVRITGAHYNFLNYCLMEQLDESSIKTGANGNKAEKIYDFSKFIDAQYWTHKIMEFCENNGFHLIIDKTRRGGFSYIMAYDSANTINLNPKKVSIHVASDSKYLTKTGGLSDFAINQLQFYELHTPFKRGILSLDPENFKLGYRNTNGSIPVGSWNSAVLSVSAFNNPDCAIGKDARKVKVEELSRMENFEPFMEVTKPAMTTGAYTTGTLYAWGTATSGDMQVFEQNFYSPKSYNFMPFENVWDKDSRNEVCGYFKPYSWGLQGEINNHKAMDKDGNSDYPIAFQISMHEREVVEKDAKTLSVYINHCGQHAEMPSESFSSASENIFSSPGLLAWEDRLKNDSTFNFYVDGNIVDDAAGNPVFKTNERLLAEGGKLNVDVFQYIQNVPRKGHENPHGCIRKWFSPEKIDEYDNNGVKHKVIPKGLYSISYDPVGVDKTKKEITNKHSHNSIKVWMNAHLLNGFKPKLVAAYYGRPDSLAESDRICYNLARYFGCIGTTGVEVNRGETISNFKSWGALKYIQRQPVFIWNTNVKGTNENHYGYNISGAQEKLEGLRLLKEMLYTIIGANENGEPIYLYNTIYDYQTILELKKWNDKGNFDRVSEMIIRGIEFTARNIKATEELKHRKKVNSNTVNENIFKRAWF